MHSVAYEQLARVEDRLWWHEARRELARSLLRRLTPPVSEAALDVGCGTGCSLGLLSEFVPRVMGLDLSPHALQFACKKHPYAELTLGDANALDRTFAPETFDIVTFFNVLYHRWIPDDPQALRQAWRVLKPGGVILVTDAAFSCLYRRHDRVGMGKRRYTLPTMRNMLEQVGFRWITGTYFNAVAFPLVWMQARWDSFFARHEATTPLAELSMPPRPINEVLKSLMALERTIIRIVGKLPWGVTLLCAARKTTCRTIVSHRADDHDGIVP